MSVYTGVLHANDVSVDDEPALRDDLHYTALHLAVLAHKRATVVRLRDERRIDDTSCARYRPRSTSRRYACPGARSSTDLTLAAQGAAVTLKLLATRSVIATPGYSRRG